MNRVIVASLLIVCIAISVFAIHQFRLATRYKVQMEQTERAALEQATRAALAEAAAVKQLESAGKARDEAVAAMKEAQRLLEDCK